MYKSVLINHSMAFNSFLPTKVESGRERKQIKSQGIKCKSNLSQNCRKKMWRKTAWENGKPQMATLAITCCSATRFKLIKMQLFQHLHSLFLHHYITFTVSPHSPPENTHISYRSPALSIVKLLRDRYHPQLQTLDDHLPK